MDATTATLYFGIIADNLRAAPLGGRGSGEVFATLADVDLQTYTKLIVVGEKMGLWTKTPGHWLQVTDKGREFADKLERMVRIQKTLDECGLK